MPGPRQGAQWAPLRRLRPLVAACLAALVDLGTLAVVTPEVRAATAKVVIVVGPVGSSTANYRYNADLLARQAASCGAANPSKSTAEKRVDNDGEGFLRSGAKAVFASGITSVGYVLKGLFRGSASMTRRLLLWSDPHRMVAYRFSFTSTRTPGATAWMDPYAPSRYDRSVIGWLNTTIGSWRSG